MDKTRSLVKATVVAVVSLVATQAQATRVQKMSAKELIQKSALIFIGTARPALEACRGVAGPCTGVGFVDIEIVAGAADRQRKLEFTLPEGPLPNGSSLKIAGAPEFVPGERYLVFVRAGAWHLTPVTNWFHSVFREVAPIAGVNVKLFVDHDGRAVTGFGEGGVVVGERVAQPNMLLRPPPTGTERSGAVASPSVSIDDKVRRALASRDAAAISALGISKAKLVEAIAAYARTIGLDQKNPVQFRPAADGRTARQASPAASDGGMSKAAPEPTLKRQQIMTTPPARDREGAKTPEARKPVESTPGRESDGKGK